MISVYQAGDDKLHIVESYLENWSLTDVLGEMRRLWNEGTGRLTFFIMGDSRQVLAIMLKCENDPEIAITVDSVTGEVVRHRCHYLTDDEGSYAGTVITPL